MDAFSFLQNLRIKLASIFFKALDGLGVRANDSGNHHKLSTSQIKIPFSVYALANVVITLKNAEHITFET